MNSTYAGPGWRLLRGEAADIDADLCQDHQGGADIDAFNLGQVHAQGVKEQTSSLETHVVPLVTAPARSNLELIVAGVGPARPAHIAVNPKANALAGNVVSIGLKADLKREISGPSARAWTV